MKAHYVQFVAFGAVAGGQGHERCEEHSQRLIEAQGRIVEPAELGARLRQRPKKHLAVRALLVAEVVVDRGDVDAGRAADVARAGRGKALGTEDRRGVTRGGCSVNGPRTLNAIKRLLELGCGADSCSWGAVGGRWLV